MILDYTYNRKQHEFSVSYITPTGSKSVLKYNVNKFKSYIEDPNGQFDNWNGKKCSIKYTERPGVFEYMTMLHELKKEDVEKINWKYNPKLYAWDIETKFDPNEFPDPHYSKFPITVISVANENLDVIELGTEDLSVEDVEWVRLQILDYLKQSPFYNQLNPPDPKFKYIKFDSEEELLRFFLKDIASKCPVMAGWNSDGFDNMYIQNRIANYYPDLSMKLASPTYSCSYKNFVDKRGDKYKLIKPDHTLMLDMMDVVEHYDLTMGPKDSLALDYIAKRCTGIGKIQYDGDLEHLRQSDYKKYIFYSSIDSILVQLINKKLRTMNNMYAQASYCKTKIGSIFSKIHATEALMFNYWYDKGVKIAQLKRHEGERGKLTGAYVKIPTPGKHNWVCCNDFSALYPSSVRSANISFENYIGCLDDGDFTKEFMEQCKKDPDYFVTVTNCIYKNDKRYAYPSVLDELTANRNKAKYLVKKIDASIITDIDHLRSNRDFKTRLYDDDVITEIKSLGYTINTSDDLKLMNLEELERVIKYDMEWLSAFEQGQKLLQNSSYGATSHESFAFFNIRIANSITGEGRNLIHLMEHHIPEFIRDNWLSMKDLHKKLGIEIKEN